MINGIKREMRMLKSGFSLVGLFAGILLATVTELSCGNFYVYRFLCLPRHAPPVFLFCFCFTIMIAMIGYACGGAYLLSGKCGHSGAGGIMFSALGAAFFILWYIAFFAAFSFLFGLFLSICGVVMLFLAFKEMWGKYYIPSVLVLLCLFFSIGYLWIDFSVIILN